MHLTNKRGDTVLHVAAKRGHVNMMLLLIQNGADMKRRNHSGQLPEVSEMTYVIMYTIMAGSQLKYIGTASASHDNSLQSLETHLRGPRVIVVITPVITVMIIPYKHSLALEVQLEYISTADYTFWFEQKVIVTVGQNTCHP